MDNSNIKSGLQIDLFALLLNHNKIYL